MENHSKLLRIVSWLLCVLMLVCTLPIGALAALVSFDTTDDNYNIVVSKKDYAISPGVTESNIVLNDKTGKNQNKIYVFEVEPNAPYAHVMASYKNQDGRNWGTQVMSAQAASAESKFGVNVVGAINTNLRFGSDEPMGILVINGDVQHEEVYSYGYFVQNKDGSYELRNGDEPLTGNEWNAVTCTGWLVKNGTILYSEDHSQVGRAPRTAIGLKADGTLVMLVNDGRNVPTSMGFTMYETAKAMVDMGCVNVINCDGGGTSTFISEREGTGELKVRNVPSDGTERPTLTGLLIISTAKPSGEFDHAAVTPSEEYYTPMSVVELSGLGVDYSGTAANSVPETATWKLADGYEKMGQITNEQISGNRATASFVSNGTEGTVKVNLINEGKVVGDATFYIQAPDELSFNSDSLNLKYEESSDLGLVAKHQGKTINLKPADIEWIISDSTAGTFDGLIFNVTNDYLASVSATVTAKYTGNAELTATTTVNVGMQPSIVLDGGDTDGLRYDHFGRGTGINGSFAWQANVKDGVIYDENTCDVISYHYMNNATSSRGGKEWLELVTSDMPEWTDIIRFGNGAVKINYDFTETNGIEGACLGFSHDIELTGSPTAIGAWVYAPEGTGNFWLRAAIKVGTSGQYTYVNFTEQCAPAWAKGTGDVGGINWTGWKYVEADLSQYAGQLIRIIKGETIRVMDCYNNYGITVNGQSGGQGSWTKDATYIPRSERKGYILVDNLQFVYGANNEDVTDPTISKITTIDSQGNETEFIDGQILDTNFPMFRFYYDDNELTDRYASGIVTKLFYFDGGNVGSGEDFSNEGFSQMQMSFSQGDHSLMCYVKDNNGNVTTKTVYFTIADSESKYPSLGVSFDENAKLYLGDTYRLNIYSDAPSLNTKEVYAKINISKNFSIQEVIPAAGYSLDRYSYSDGVLELAVKPNSEATSGTVVATVVVKAPTDLSEGSSFEWRVSQGWLSILEDTYTKKEHKLDWGFATKTVKLTVASKYTVSSDVMIVGIDGNVSITDENGTPVAGAEIVDYISGAPIGSTDANGILRTDYFAKASGKWTVYAKDANGAVSFPTEIASYPAIGEDSPYYIVYNATNDPAHSKNITWMTNPSKAMERALVRISTATDMSDAAEIEGKCNRISYKTTNVANFSSRVIVKGLTANTTYYYQVGDGNTWSEIKSFKTASEITKQTNFFIIGDMQGEDAIVAAKYSELLKKAGIFDFGVQLGDGIDNVNEYGEWKTAMGVFSSGIYADTDILHVIGNHETFGDSNADAARSIFGSLAYTAGGYYSCEYGQVYVATFGYTLDDNVKQSALDWLVEDAKKSDCPWKILVIHVPTYYSNSEQRDSLFYNEKLPAAAAAAGITCVFSGHDHSYARTSEIDGVTYYIAGTAGEKKYTCSDNGFPFVSTTETGIATPTQDYGSIYITGYATNDSLSILTYDVDANGNQTLIDKFERKLEVCSKHEYELSEDGTTLICGKCNNAEDFDTYIGLYKHNGAYYYDYIGQNLGGWVQIGEKWHYFRSYTKAAVTGEYTVNGVTYLFDETGMTNGAWHTDDKGTRYYYGPSYYVARNPGYMTLHEIDGKTYNFGNDGYLTYGIQVLRDSTSFKKYVFDFGNDGVLVREIREQGLFTAPDGIYYINENGYVPMGTGLIKIEDAYYYVCYSGKLKQSGNQTITEKYANGLLPAGTYYFGVDGKMVVPTEEDHTTGIVWDEANNRYVYKVDGKIQKNAGLIKIEDAYYYVCYSGKLKQSGNQTIAEEYANGLLPAGTYYFGEDGKMVTNN